LLRQSKGVVNRGIRRPTGRFPYPGKGQAMHGSKVFANPGNLSRSAVCWPSGWGSVTRPLQHTIYVRQLTNNASRRKGIPKMKKCLVLIAVALLVVSLPAMAGKVVEINITHPIITLYQAYAAPDSAGAQSIEGYLGFGDYTITSDPGILQIVPGVNWSNFIAAPSDVGPFIKNVTLTKVTGMTGQCSDVFPVITVNQQGTPNIRLWWPLMYELPGTTWTLTVFYGTRLPYADSANPTVPAYAHTEVWEFAVDADIPAMENELELFHQLPFGLDEVPLVSDEVAYPILQGYLAEAETYLLVGDLFDGGNALEDFEMLVSDECITTSPAFPDPTGVGTGIANTDENPACCKLLADTEYVGFKYNLFQPSK